MVVSSNDIRMLPYSAAVQPLVQTFCQLSNSCSASVEDLSHISGSCFALIKIREKLTRFTLDYCEATPEIKHLVLQFCVPYHPQFCQFLLDCSVLPQVILARQMHGDCILHHLFHISRTWVYHLHRARMKLVGRRNQF